MSRTANITLHIQVALVEIRTRKPRLASRLWNHAKGIARALAPSYSVNF